MDEPNKLAGVYKSKDLIDDLKKQAPQGFKCLSDPWEHRASRMSCKTCMWSVEKGGNVIGRCRKHAPTLSGYPVIYMSDWCGDHKLDENKV